MARIGNYEVLKQIGEGGFGRVYQAEHIYLGEKACIKQNINPTKDDVRLLRHEAKVLWKLYEHHSIPQVKDYFEVDKETGIIVLSYIDGKTLEEVVEKKGPLYPEDACWITERLLGALYYSHYNGVIHSDVKPENVFVEPGKHDVKLIDFGLATYKPDSKTRPLGYSPKYAAPELIQGKPPLPETDIYGAGIVMLRALGGDVSKKSFRSDTPKPIVEFCESLLRYDPNKRPNWDKENPLERISDIRLEVFKRRHLSEKLKPLKGGVS